MSDLELFLHPIRPVDETTELAVSDRFCGPDGKPAAFRVRAMTQEENDALVRASTHPDKGFDSVEFSHRVVVEATVWPDFRSSELCKGYGVMDPLELPGKMLKSGEYKRLMNGILKISDLSDKTEDAAKN